ncbi:MAG: KamA family radical SAM protein [Candidatus Aureabacteria bacterium]|nr:KamA family radical SAM protein [Candidatus Auribacterota bacterium]
MHTQLRARMWKDVTETDWNNWKWQVKNRVCSLAELSRVLKLTPEEEGGIRREEDRLPMAVTPYFLSLIDPENPECPLRRQVIPRIEEHFLCSRDLEDPCGEEGDTPVPRLVHRYPDRVLVIATDACVSYCRYCTRKRIVGKRPQSIDREQLEKVCDYISGNKRIRDVLVSGGDPLSLCDEKIETILKALRSIRHVEIIRIGTRMPVFLPQRITPALVEMLRKYHPLYASIHFSHPREITPETTRACEMLADGGIPLGSQTVLLRGINDNASTIKKLLQELMMIRVRPYYLYQCDLAVGTEHFRTPISTGINIMEKLRGHTSGYAVPTFVVDSPGGGGKIPLSPSYFIALIEGKAVLRNYEGKIFEYPEPVDSKKIRVKLRREEAPEGAPSLLVT